MAKLARAQQIASELTERVRSTKRKKRWLVRVTEKRTHRLKCNHKIEQRRTENG